VAVGPGWLASVGVPDGCGGGSFGGGGGGFGGGYNGLAGGDGWAKGGDDVASGEGAGVGTGAGVSDGVDAGTSVVVGADSGVMFCCWHEVSVLTKISDNIIRDRIMVLFIIPAPSSVNTDS
jgi:hypothetical protein